MIAYQVFCVLSWIRKRFECSFLGLPSIPLSQLMTSFMYRTLVPTPFRNNFWNAFISGPGSELANEDTLLRTHCCRHKYFPVCPRAQHLLRTQILCPGQKKVSDFVQKHFVSATNVSQFAQHGNTTFILCPARLRAQETS